MLLHPTYVRASNYDKWCQYNILYQPARRRAILPAGMGLGGFCSWSIIQHVHPLCAAAGGAFQILQSAKTFLLENSRVYQNLYSIFSYRSHHCLFYFIFPWTPLLFMLSEKNIEQTLALTFDSIDFTNCKCQYTDYPLWIICEFTDYPMNYPLTCSQSFLITLWGSSLAFTCTFFHWNGLDQKAEVPPRPGNLYAYFSSASFMWFGIFQYTIHRPQIEIKSY